MRAILDAVEHRIVRNRYSQRVLQRLRDERTRAKEAAGGEQWHQLCRDAVRRRVDVVQLEGKRRGDFRHPVNGGSVHHHLQLRAIDRRDDAVGRSGRVRVSLIERVEAKDHSRVERITTSGEQQTRLLTDGGVALQRGIDSDRLDHRVLQHDILCRTKERACRSGVELLATCRDRDCGDEAEQDDRASTPARANKDSPVHRRSKDFGVKARGSSSSSVQRASRPARVTLITTMCGANSSST